MTRILIDLAMLVGIVARAYQLKADWKAMGLGGFQYQYCGLSILFYLLWVVWAAIAGCPEVSVMSCGAILVYGWIVEQKVQHAIQNRWRRPTRTRS